MKKPWYKNAFVIIIASVVVLLIVFGIGVASAPKPKDQTKEVAALKASNKRLRGQVNDRAAQTAADNAHAAKVAADQKKAADDKATADAKAAADKAAADKKAADDAAAAQAAAAAKKNTIDGDGVRGVGSDINPGTYHTDGTGTSCYYAILNSTDTSDIADNNNVNGPVTVTLRNGQYFETERCGTWTHQ